MNDLVVSPNPVTTDGRSIVRGAELMAGESLASFLTRNGVDLRRGDWAVSIGGAQVPALLWDRTRPKHGHLIECRRTAGKQVIMLVAIVFIAWITMGAGLAALGVGAQAGLSAGAIAASGVGGLAGALGMSAGFAALAVNAGAMMLGTMLLQKLMPPPKARLATFDAGTVSQTYSISGGRNTKRPYEPLALLFGQMRVIPDYAADPFQAFEGDDQYQYVRLHAGINCGDVTDLKVGDTLLSTYTDVTVSRSGFPGSTTKLTDWANVDTIAGGTLDAVAAPGAYVTRTTSADTVRIAIDIGASLYSMGDDGNQHTTTVALEAECRLLPSGSWEPLISGFATITLVSASTKPLRQTFVSGALAQGQYEVRLRKTTANVSTTRAANALEWGTLKSYQLDNHDYSAHPHVGIRIKASGQINGALDSINWVATARATPLWDGSAWSTVATRNPGAQMLQFSRGIYDDDGRLMAGLGLPDEQIDIAGLKSFMVHCTELGFTFDHWFDSALSCDDVLDAMAAAGRGSQSYHTGKRGVVWLRDDQPLECIVAMPNIKRGSFRVDYATRALAEELEISWPDRDDGGRQRSLRVKAPGVDVPRDTARLAPLGITTEAAAAGMARFVMAQNLFQRKSVTWEMDLEHLQFRRFSLVALSHDMTKWGSSGRLKGATLDGSGRALLTLDEIVKPRTGATAWCVGLRLPGEASYRVFDVVGVIADTHTLTTSLPWPDDLDLPGAHPEDPAYDTLWIFDFKEEPGQRLRISSIEPTGDLSGARITAVPEGDDFWSYVNTGAYVATAPTVAAVALVASDVRITQDRLGLNYDARMQLTVTFKASGPFDHAQIWAGPTGGALVYLGSTNSGRYTDWTVDSLGVWNVEVRPFTALGQAGAVGTGTVTVTLEDTLRAPSATLGIKRNVADFAGTLNWNECWIHGRDVSGTAVDEPGKIFVNGQIQSVPNGLLYGSQGPHSSFIAWDAASTVFVIAGGSTSVPCAAVRKYQGQWQFDNNSLWTNFTPNAAIYIVGTVESGAPDTGFPGTPPGIIAATMWTYAATLDAIGSLGDTAIWAGVQGPGKPDDYATRNKLFKQSTDPALVSGAVLDGDRWQQTTSGVVTAIWDRVAGAWSTGPAGPTGAPGASVYTASVYLQTGSAPSAPTGGSFNFNSGVLTPPSGWSASQPATTTTPTYLAEFTFTTTTPASTVAGGTWTAPVVDAVAGSAGGAGSSVFTVEIYLQTGGSAPSAPTGGSYTFSTDSLTPPSGWTRNKPASSTTPTYRTAYTFATTTPGTAVAAGAWSTPVVVSLNGTDGAPGSSVYTASVYLQTGSAPSAPTGGSFNFNSGVLTPPSGWSASQPATTTTPTYLAEFTFTTTTPASTVVGGTWTAPVVDAVAGSPGGAGSSVFTVEIYLQTGGSAPSAPTGGSYTFSTDSLTPPSGWTRNKPASSTTPTYRTAYTFATTTPGTAVAAGAWSTPVVVSLNGTDGAPGSSVYTASVYLQTGSAPSAPTGGSYNFNSGVLTPPSGWSASQPATTTTPTYLAEFTFTTTTPASTVAGGTWTAPVVDAVAGSAGGAGSSVFTVEIYLQTGGSAPSAPTGGSYTFSTDSLTPPSGWTRNKPASSTTPTYRCGFTFETTTPGTALTAGTWSTPVVVAQNGSDGVDAISSGLTLASFSLPADSVGLVSSYTGATTTMSVVKGITDDSANWSFSRVDSSGVTSNLSGASNNVATVTAMTTGTDVGTVTITATRSGHPTQVRVFALSKAKAAVPASGPVSAAGFYDAYNIKLSPNDCSCYVEFRRDGSVYVGYNPSTNLHAGDWYLPNGTTVGDAYEIRFDLLTSSGLSSGISGGTVGAWVALTSNRGLTLSTTENSNATRVRIYSYAIRNASTAAVVCTGTFNMQSDVEI